jgi:hypothetical protein
LVAVAKSEAIDGLGVDTWLLHTSSCSRVAGLVDCGLQLLEEAINVLEITLGASVGQWKRVAVLSHGAMHIGASIATSTS